jgi:hypothetical protein
MGYQPGFMIALNERDFESPFEGGMRNICLPANQATYTQAEWWTNENIWFTGSVDPTTARVGDTVVIQVGVSGIVFDQASIQQISAVQNVEAWVCYPNTVPGGANPALVVPSMQNNGFASYSNTTPTAAPVQPTGQYQGGLAYAVVSLSTWTPTEEDFLVEATEGGHCCIIANAAGQADLQDWELPNTGTPVGVVITDNSQLQADINICESLYQGQRNVIIVPAPQGEMVGRLAFLSGAPGARASTTATVTATAIDQGGQLDPVLQKVLSAGPHSGLPLKAASSPPRSLRLSRHRHRRHRWLDRIIHEAEEITEELLGIATHPFGGGHRLHLRLPKDGLQPLGIEVELERGEVVGTVHCINIVQTNPDGSRGGIRMGVVVV